MSKNNFAALSLSALAGNKEASLLAAANDTARAIYLTNKDGNANALQEEFTVYCELLAVVQTGKANGKKASPAVVNTAIAVTGAFRAALDAAPFLRIAQDPKGWAVQDTRQRKRGEKAEAEVMESACRDAFIASYTASVKGMEEVKKAEGEAKKLENAQKAQAEAEAAQTEAAEKAAAIKAGFASEMQAADDAILALSALPAVALDSLAVLAIAYPDSFALLLQEMAVKAAATAQAEAHANAAAAAGKAKRPAKAKAEAEAIAA